MTGRALLLIAMSAAFSCMVPEITLDDAKCDAAARCVEGYVCDPATRRCVVNNECACVEGVPETWTGPFYLVTTTAGTDVGPCPGGDTPVVLHSGPPNGDVGCFDCACGEADGRCLPAPLQCRENDCQIGEHVQASVEQCTQFLASSIQCRLDGEGSYEGSCAPQQIGEAALPGWQTDLTLCELPVDPRCGAGHCENPALEAKVCIRQEGETACPPPWDEAIVAYAGAEDTRACTECSCTTAIAGCGQGSYGLYGSNADCNNNNEPIGIIDSTMCSATLLGVEWVKGYGDETPEDPHCEPEGGAVDGTFVPQNRMTLCCLAS